MDEIEELRVRGGLRAWRPGRDRLPEADFQELVGEFSQPRRPLDAAARAIARDGLRCVGTAQRVNVARAAALVAVRLGLPPRRLLRWCHYGFDLARLGYDFAIAVEQLEYAGLVKDTDILCKKAASEGQIQADSTPFGG
jgi:hypothetical protein